MRPEPDISLTFPMDELEASTEPEVLSAPHMDTLFAVVIQSNRVIERTIGMQ
jgi:hypothetical protein